MRWRVFAAAATLLALAVSPALAAKKPFTPKQISGVWVGTWTNQTFNSSGPISLQGKLKRHGKAFQFLVDLGGNALGCPNPSPERTPTIKKGKGKNHWNAKGFRLNLSSPAYGAFDVTYKQSTHKLTGSGGNPSCAPGVTWALDGTLTHSTFTGTVTIHLSNGQTASSTISADRQ